MNVDPWCGEIGLPSYSQFVTFLGLMHLNKSTGASLILSRVDTCRHYWTWRLVLMHGKQACNHTIWGLLSVPKKTNPLEDDFSVNMSKVGSSRAPYMQHIIPEGIWRWVILLPQYWIPSNLRQGIKGEISCCMDVSWNRGTPKSSIYRWISHEINHPAIGVPPFMEIQK